MFSSHSGPSDFGDSSGYPFLPPKTLFDVNVCVCVLWVKCARSPAPAHRVALLTEIGFSLFHACQSLFTPFWSIGEWGIGEEGRIVVYTTGGDGGGLAWFFMTEIRVVPLHTTTSIYSHCQNPFWFMLAAVRCPLFQYMYLCVRVHLASLRDRAAAAAAAAAFAGRLLAPDCQGVREGTQQRSTL